MEERFKTKLQIRDLCNQIINLDMEKYDLSSITFKLKGFSFIKIVVEGYITDLNTYFNKTLPEVPYFKLVELFDVIQKHSNIKNEYQEILYPLECKIYFTASNLCSGWQVKFVSRDIDLEELTYSVNPEEWEKDVRL